ncbi:MAG: hypothetical protein HUK22_04970, partial [Thermoguttaceae bacterium]|nr:hypothetical protein [Thermoguttaceae bacterium]
AMLDGSVRFISETIDWGTDGRSAKDQGKTSGKDSIFYMGKSLYGVWGALGSVNGGETLSL